MVHPSISVASRELNCGRFRLRLGGAPGVEAIFLPASDRNILRAFGVETANRHGFFTLEHAGLNCRLIEGHVEERDRGYRRRWIHYLGPYGFRANEQLDVNEATVRRRLKVTPIGEQPTPLFDLVLRWGLSPNDVDSISIGGRTLVYQRANLYHQFSARAMSLCIGDSASALDIANAGMHPSGMEQVLYARDSAEGWILHHRLVTTSPDDYYVRCCTKWYRGIIPTPKSFWRRFARLARLLYLIRERSIPRFPIQLMGDVVIPPSNSLEFEHTFRFGS